LEKEVVCVLSPNSVFLLLKARGSSPSPNLQTGDPLPGDFRNQHNQYILTYLPYLIAYNMWMRYAAVARILNI
jgi:hypothetical protein